MRSNISASASPYGPNVPFSRTQSMRSTISGSGLPYGAKAHRASWSTRDFQEDMSEEVPPNTRRYSVESVREAAMRHRASSIRSSSGNILLAATAEAADEESSNEQPKVGKRASRSYTPRPGLDRRATTVNEENEGPEEDEPSTVTAAPAKPTSAHHLTTAPSASPAGTALAAALAAAKGGTGNGPA